MRALVPMLMLLLWTGCAGSAATARTSSAVSPATAGEGSDTPAPDALAASNGAGQPGRIPRERLIVTLDAGLGRFLGSVRVDPVLERGGFVGFRIVSFRDPEGIYTGVDLLPGDVVTRVNGSPIERPEQALSVWNGLRVTSELCVEYMRNGVRREIRYPIVD